MTLYAYLRVSTDTQDVNNQKFGVLEYCAMQKLGVPELVPDTVSGKIDWEQREIGRLLARCAPGDILVVGGGWPATSRQNCWGTRKNPWRAIFSEFYGRPSISSHLK